MEQTEQMDELLEDIVRQQNEINAKHGALADIVGDKGDTVQLGIQEGVTRTAMLRCAHHQPPAGALAALPPLTKPLEADSQRGVQSTGKRRTSASTTSARSRRSNSSCKSSSASWPTAATQAGWACWTTASPTRATMTTTLRAKSTSRITAMTLSSPNTSTAVGAPLPALSRWSPAVQHVLPPPRRHRCGVRTQRDWRGAGSRRGRS